MTQREKNLAIAVLVLVVGYGAWIGMSWWNEGVTRRQSEIDAATIAVADAQLRESRAKASLRKLEEYRERSLPNDAEVAQSEYRAWLVDRFSQSGLEFDRVRRVSAPTRRGDAYTTMAFKAQAEGGLDAVVKFLHAFYSSRATHKLTQLKLQPSGDDGRLRVEIDVEALIVAGVARKSGLPEESSERLQQAGLDNYLASITGRSLFAEYAPPPPPPRVEKKVVKKPPSKPPLDHSEHARFTGTVGSEASMQAWVRVLTTGDVLRLSAGDELEVGMLKGRVVEVSPRELVYETDSQQVSVPLGKKLREGKPRRQG